MRRLSLLSVTRHHLFVSGVVLAAVLVTAASVLTTPRAREQPPLGPTAGAATAFGSVAWLWSGRSLCQQGAPPLGSGLLRRRLSGERTPLQVPLLVVRALAAGPGELLAVGRDRSCSPAAYRSTDEGAHWVRLPDLGGATSVQFSRPDVLWSVTATAATGSARLHRAVRGSAVAIRQPCPTGTQPSLVSGQRESWLLCQDPLGLRRTLAHTADGGTSWDVPGNELSGGGLDGVGIVSMLDMHLAPYGWLLKPARRCPEGELRTTRNAGNDWTSLPCPRATIPVSQVLALTFTDPQHGVLLGVRGVRTVVALTADGGAIWALAQ